MSSAYQPNGRLGDPDLFLGKDRRGHPELVAALRSLNLAGHIEVPYPDQNEDVQKLQQMMQAADDGFSAMYDSHPLELPEDKDQAPVEQNTIVVDSSDEYKVELHFFSPVDRSGPLPAVVYLHGGGMTFLKTMNNVHKRWCTDIALQGVVVVAVNYRNSLHEATHCPFPTGLNDIAAGVKYLAARKTELGITKVVLQGESGGGNLALATALKANKEGWIDVIAGVYAVIPLISGAYGWSKDHKLSKLPSMVENDGYFLGLGLLASLVQWYTPKESDRTNPLAWPYHATEADLRGLPPHVLSMDELDPLRDEGIAYYRKLLAAGVPASANVNLGTFHGSALIFRQAFPELNRNMIGSIAAFAKRM